MEFTYRDLHLKVFTKKAFDIVSSVVSSSRTLNLYSGVLQLPSNEVVVRECCGAYHHLLPAETFKKKIVRRFKFYINDYEKSLRTTTNAEWAARTKEHLLYVALVLGMLEGESADALVEKFGKDRYEELIGIELDPMKSACIEKLQNMIDEEKKKAQDDITEFNRKRISERDAVINKLKQEIASLQA